MDLDQLVRRAQPSDTADPVDSNWADSAHGRAVFDGVLRRSRFSAPPGGNRITRRTRLLLTVVAAAAALAGVGAAAGIVFGGEPPPDWRNPDGAIACADELSAKPHIIGVVPAQAGVDAIETCRQEFWLKSKGVEPPAPLVACVYAKDGGAGGALFILPNARFHTAADACASVGMYKAPEEAVANPGG